MEQLSPRKDALVRAAKARALVLSYLREEWNNNFYERSAKEIHKALEEPLNDIQYDVARLIQLLNRAVKDELVSVNRHIEDPNHNKYSFRNAKPKSHKKQAPAITDTLHGVVEFLPKGQIEMVVCGVTLVTDIGTKISISLSDAGMPIIKIGG